MDISERMVVGDGGVQTVPVGSARMWMPERVLFMPAALVEPWGRQIHERITALGLPIEELRSNRLIGLRGVDERETYKLAKGALAVVTAPPSAFKLQPTPPSADWQFNVAEGCPADCQYCYLAGSLQGPPVTRRSLTSRERNLTLPTRLLAAPLHGGGWLVID